MLCSFIYPVAEELPIPLHPDQANPEAQVRDRVQAAAQETAAGLAAAVLEVAEALAADPAQAVDRAVLAARVPVVRDPLRAPRQSFFIPPISSATRFSAIWSTPRQDPSDPKLAHLDRLNLRRAWMLEGIASALPKGDKRLPAILASAEAHRRAGLATVTGEHYEGGHWLGSFAVYLVTRRGISNK